MVRRRRTGNITFPKRATLWLPFDVTNVLTTAGTVVASGDLLGNYFSQTGEEVPVGTTLGPIRWTSQLAPAVGSVISSAFKAEMVMQLEKEGGRATLPVPGVDIIDAPWYGQMFYNLELQETAAGVFNGAAVSERFETRAMRKVTGNGQILRIFAVPNSNTDYNLNHIGQVFLKLP